ncbi:hypothetical protein ACLKA6_010028 [Drosophila palustris]
MPQRWPITCQVGTFTICTFCFYPSRAQFKFKVSSELHKDHGVYVVATSTAADRSHVVAFPTMSSFATTDPQTTK